jgi:hypothetical protein
MSRQLRTPTPFIRLVRLIRQSIRRPSDVALAIRIGYFVLIIPRKLAKADLPRFLREVRESQRPSADDMQMATERIIRLRSLWLWLPMLSSRNTCYVRALTLYRFLDSKKSDIRLYFGVEPGINPNDRLRGHAWVTVDGKIMEPPDPVLSGRVKTIYSHPPVA